jgi:apolipoprotein N-acyltransferase
LSRPGLGRRLVPAALALAGGAVWAACQGERELLVAPWVALVPLFLLLDQRRPGRLGFLHGLATWLVGVWWIAPTLGTYGGLPRAASWLLLLAVASYLALYHAAFAALGARFWRLGGGFAWLGLPALWVALEWARGWLLTGFPWNLAAYAATPTPGALQLSSWIGAYGVSFVVVVANCGVALAVARRRLAPAAAAAGVALLLLALAGRWAGVRMEEEPHETDGRPVRIVQPNIPIFPIAPNLASSSAGAVWTGYQRLLRLSRAACDEPGALLVWPESASWPLSLEEPQLRAEVEALAAAGCPVLLNSTREADGRLYNAVFLVGPGGARDYADKRHLVPFGEYVPLEGVLPFVGRLARAAGDFAPAEELRLLDWEDERLGLAICFEVIFPGEVAQAVRRGATVLVTVTNDAWYGPTSAPWQHFRAARWRAAENRRPLLRAAITGVSGLITADGSVAAQLGVGEEGILRGRVTGRRALSPFARAPWAVPALCVLAAALAVAASRRVR